MKSIEARMTVVAALAAFAAYLVLAMVLAALGDFNKTFDQTWRWWHPALALFLATAWSVAAIAIHWPAPPPNGLTEEEWGLVKEFRKP